MSFIAMKCPKCNKKVIETSRARVGAKVFVVYDCGHSLVADVLGALDEIKSADAVRAELEKAQRQAEIQRHPAELVLSSDKKSLYPFQVNTVKAIENALFVLGLKGFLVGHEMGLGKTPISLILLKLYMKDMGPCLMIVKSALKVQFFQECLRWIGPQHIPQIIESAKEKPDPGFDIHIIGIDLVRRMGTRLLEYGYKTIIIDECQLVKNTEAQRTRGIRDLAEAAKFVLGLSGTAIKNHAGEYFSILNMIAPNLFNSKYAFYQNECKSEYDKRGNPKPGGLRNPDEFFYKTRNFILRYEREEVMPDLPICSRSYRYCDLGKEVAVAYEKALQEFCDYMETNTDSGMAFYSNTLAYLSKMRHLTGLAKVDAAIDFCMEFLGSRETDKLTIFNHHKDVGYSLHAALGPVLEELGFNPPLTFTGDLDSNTRAEVIKEFRENPKNRIMICSTLAGGEGINLQFCHDFVLLERQWNPANEEQAEARFIRIGQVSSKVSGTYIVAVGTIDEFFAELVEKKREIMLQTLSGKDVKWEESSLIKELGEQLYRQGRTKRWKY